MIIFVILLFGKIHQPLLIGLILLLGIALLLSDVFFLDMAVVITFGLGFASLLTLIVVPVLYAIYFNIKTRN